VREGDLLPFPEIGDSDLRKFADSRVLVSVMRVGRMRDRLKRRGVAIEFIDAGLTGVKRVRNRVSGFAVSSYKYQMSDWSGNDRGIHTSDDMERRNFISKVF
jgi:hypothetical protein